MTLDHAESTLKSIPRPAANLIVKQGPQIGILFPITAIRVVLGREDTCDIVIQDAEVSRRHTEVTWDGKTYIIQDLGSTNGTFVNGIHVTEPSHLKPNSTIGIGQTVLAFETEPVEPPLKDYETPLLTSRPLEQKGNDTTNNASDPKRLIFIGCGIVAGLWVCGGATAAALYFAGIFP